MKKSAQPISPEPTHEAITALAHQIYEEEGCPCGKAEEHWLEAERRLCQNKTCGEAGTIAPVAQQKEPRRESLAA